MNPEDTTDKTRKRREDLRRLGFTVARLREERHITQTDLAVMLGYTNHSHLSRIENGKKAPSVLLLLDIADILEVNIKDLFGDF